MKTANHPLIRMTCPLQRLFAPQRQPAREPDWEELELARRETGGQLELRLLHRGEETGRLVAERGRDDGFRHKGTATGPRWCRDLLEEAAAEWAREGAVRP